MNPILNALMTSVLFLGLAGCASSAKRFESIVPGMSGAAVTKAMDHGPSNFETPTNSEYTTWYFGPDHCVLFKSDHVVAKDSATSGNSAGGYGVSYDEKRLAQCLAPGQAAKRATERAFKIPGVGSIHLPESNLEPRS